MASDKKDEPVGFVSHSEAFKKVCKSMGVNQLTEDELMDWYNGLSNKSVVHEMQYLAGEVDIKKFSIINIYRKLPESRRLEYREVILKKLKELYEITQVYKGFI